jgi:hypothetical protein
MKKYALFLAVLLLASCSQNNEPTISCKLNKVKIITLIYDDLSPIIYSTSFSGNLTLEYNNDGSVSKVYGAFLNYPSGSSLSNWANNDNTYDEYNYSGNTLTVTHSANRNEKPYIKEFNFANNGQLLSKKVTNLYPFTSSPINYTYEYIGDTILEKSNGTLYRTFYLSNGNLQRVEKLMTNLSGQIIGKNEYTFENYDNTPNLLKGMYYINGAFFKAFSNNNFQKYTYQNYNYVNNEFVPNGNSKSISFSLTYNSDNVASIFEQNCN